MHHRKKYLELGPCLVHRWTARPFPDGIAEDSVFQHNDESDVDNLLGIQGCVTNPPAPVDLLLR